MEPLFSELFSEACLPFTIHENLFRTTNRTLKVDMPERYIINENATILFWKNRDKTVVKRCEEDEFNPRLAFLTAFFQHYCGMSKNKANKYLAGLEIEKKEEKEQYKPKHMKEKFKIGDRVYHSLYGAGKIIDINSNNETLVEFKKEHVDLHSGFGKGKENHCWWCNKDNIAFDLTKEEK